MADRHNINVSTNPQIAAAFREMASHYSNRLGLCLTASMVMFMEADPRVQAEYLTKVLQAELKDEMDVLLKEVRGAQFRKVQAADQKPRSRS